MKMIHGWVLDCRYGHFVKSISSLAMSLSKARVFSTRKEARQNHRDEASDSVEVARKVEVDENGNAVKIIPGR